MRRVLILASAALLLAAVADAAQSQRSADRSDADTWEKRFTLTGRPDVRVETNDAHVEVRTWERNEIQAHVYTVGWRISGDEVRVFERQTDNRVALEVRIPEPRWNWRSRNRSVRIELTVPQQADIEVRTGDGRVSLEPISGRIRVHTGDGSISAKGLRGEIFLSSGDGRIEGSGFDGALEATTGDGRITVDGRFTRLRVRTGDGTVAIGVDSGSKMDAPWSVRTNDGNIVLRLPGDFAANLDASTGDGAIQTDFDVSLSGTISHSSMRGKINGGGALFEVRTGDGSISLLRR